MAVGGNFKVDTIQLQNCINELEEICRNIDQVHGKISDCMENLKNYWTSIGTNDRNTYVNDLNKRLVELKQFVNLLIDFKLLLDYYKEGYEEQAKGEK